MADELDIMATFIYQRLAANGTISGIVGTRIYQDVAPQDATMPYVVYTSLAPRDLRAVGAIRIASRDEWLVKAVKQTNAFGDAQLTSLSDAIDDVLHGDDGVSGVVSGGNVIHSYRERPFRMSEVNNGINYKWKGAIYNLMAQVN